MERKLIKDVAREIVEIGGAQTIVQADTTLKALVEVIKTNLTKGNEINLYGLGVFSVVDKTEKKARNPKTGEEIIVAAHTAPKFKFTPSLKTAIR